MITFRSLNPSDLTQEPSKTRNILRNTTWQEVSKQKKQDQKPKRILIADELFLLSRIKNKDSVYEKNLMVG